MSACAFILMLVVLILAIISLIGFWKSDSVLGAKWSITCMLIIVVACFYTSFRSEPFKIDDEVAFIGVIAAIVAVPVTVTLRKESDSYPILNKGGHFDIVMTLYKGHIKSPIVKFIWDDDFGYGRERTQALDLTF